MPPYYAISQSASQRSEVRECKSNYPLETYKK